MIKQIKHYSEVEDKIIEAVDTIANPVRQTIGPKGGNVIFEDDNGNVSVTNDGVTIAKNIHVKDPIVNSIVQVIKESALKTNSQAGDGTSTTILLSSILIKEGLKLVRDGKNQRDVTEAFRKFADALKAQLKKVKREVKNDDDLFSIVKISANNDEEIAKFVVRVVRTAGEDGYVFLEPSSNSETEIEEDTGFIIEAGMVTPELSTTEALTATYRDVPVLITDKQLYYAQEAETILNTVLQAGYKEVVIVARNFVGEALPFFVANHRKGIVRSLLVKDPNVDKTNGATLEDLAIYLDGEVVSDKAGKIVDKLTIENFAMAKQVYADMNQAVISKDETDDKRLKSRVKVLKSELKKFSDEDESSEKRILKKRLASLTNGIVTVRIGGSTPLEIREKRFRYEDAISAGRAAVKDGYLLGGGLSVFRAFERMKDTSEYSSVFRKVAEANIRQIAENAGEYPDNVVKITSTIPDEQGYNALNDNYESFVKAGIFDPYKVTEMAITNAISIASMVLGSRYLVVNDTEDGKSKD